MEEKKEVKKATPKKESTSKTTKSTESKSTTPKKPAETKTATKDSKPKTTGNAEKPTTKESKPATKADKPAKDNKPAETKTASSKAPAKSESKTPDKREDDDKKKKGAIILSDKELATEVLISQSTDKTKSKKMFVIIAIVAAIILAVAVTMLVLFLPKKGEPKEQSPTIASFQLDLSSIRDGEETALVGGESKTLTTANIGEDNRYEFEEQIEKDEVLKFKYSFDNVGDSPIDITLEFREVSNDNCSITYSIGDNTPADLDNIIEYSIAKGESVDIVVYIQVIDTSINAYLEGDLCLVITSYNAEV